MKILAVLAVTVLSTNAVSYFDLVNEEWTAFKMQYNKQYSSETEESFRKKIFMENSHMIAKHNQLYEEDLVSYKLKLNKWGDMLHFEFVQNLNGFNATLKAESAVANLTVPATFIPPANVDLPDSVDWRTEGAVTPIKDQGQCGSCWSFAATGAIEGQHFRKSKTLVSLSEQNLVDCSGSFGNLGCFGGSFVYAFNYVISNRGIATEESYPYKPKQSTCVYNPNMSGATIASYSIIAQNSEADLQSAVATVGPTAVAIDASHSSFQFYSEGVYYEPQCSATALDHGVLVVGYGTDTDHDYWLVKNSWGTTWGDQGYIKMSRNRRNNCGIATQASYPLV